MSEEAQDSLRDDVTAALDADIAANTETPATETGTVTPTAGGEETPAVGPARDESGRFAPKDAPEPIKAPVKPELQPAAAAPLPSATLPSATLPGAPKPLRPPGGWKPEAKAEWDKLPPQVQAEVVRRERETYHTLQTTAQTRQAFQAFQQVLAPFQANIAAYGGDAVNMIQTLARVDSTLRFGTSHEKATALAEIIKSSGVDITALDNALAGLPAPEETQQEERFQRLIEERLGPVNDMLSQIQSARQASQQHVAQTAVSELEQFAQKVDIEPVRETMADLIERAAARGEAMTYDQAYEQAAWLHPELRRSMIAREQAQLGQQATQAAARARAASVSVSGAPALAPPGSNGQDLSLRDTISAAIDAHSQRV